MKVRRGSRSAGRLHRINHEAHEGHETTTRVWVSSCDRLGRRMAIRRLHAPCACRHIEPKPAPRMLFFVIFVSFVVRVS